MKLTVLGKYGPYPAIGGATSGYLLSGENFSVMLDFGSGVASRLGAYKNIEELDAIILSHTHFDHCSDLLVLSYALKKKIKLYLPKNQQGGLASTLASLPCFEVQEYDENSSFEINGAQFSFAKMIHPVTSYAVKVQENTVFVYTGDTVYNQDLVEFCKGANFVLADAMQKEGFLGPHMSVKNAYDISVESGVKVLCTHFPSQNSGDTTKYLGLVPVEENTTYQI